MTTRRPSQWSLIGLLPAALLPVAAWAQTPSIIVTGRYVAADGSIQPGLAVRCDRGKIKALDSAEDAASGGDVALYPDSVLCPGLIDLLSALSVHGARTETRSAIDPEVRAIDAINWAHRDFRTALAGGVTTAMIAPRAVNLVSGTAAVIKTHAQDRTVLRREGPMVMALGPSVWRFDRAPTSRSGSLAMLREAIDAARDGEGTPRLQAVIKGQLDSMMICAAAMDVSAALRVLNDAAEPAVIAYTGPDHDIAEELAGRETIVVVGPYTLETPPRDLALAGALAMQDVAVALAGQLPIQGRDGLRMTAAMAVRYGMDPAAARRAMTSTAARAAGVSERVGSIEVGRDADFVVFSDDPLRLDARVLAVYVDGVRVYANDAGR